MKAAMTRGGNERFASTPSNLVNIGSVAFISTGKEVEHKMWGKGD